MPGSVAVWVSEIPGEEWACRRGIRRKRCNPAVSTIFPMRIPGHRTPIRGFVGSRRGPGRRNCNVPGPRLLGRPPKTTPQTAECPSQDTPLPHRTPPIRPRRDPVHAPGRAVSGNTAPRRHGSDRREAPLGETTPVFPCGAAPRPSWRRDRTLPPPGGSRSPTAPSTSARCWTSQSIHRNFDFFVVFIQSHADFGTVKRICISLCVVYIRLCGIRSLAVRHGTKPNIHKGLLTISA